jgi:hypothetical protein
MTADHEWYVGNFHDIAECRARIEALEAALREIAGQMLISEHDEDYNGDYEAGYEAIIRIARAALSSRTQGK